MLKNDKNYPDSLKKSVIYQMFLRAFTPEGTLNAAAKLLPHIRDIGMDIIYLCPIVEADDDMRLEYWSERQKKSGTENPKNPYRIKDYYNIDPEYGNSEDLSVFVKTAHSLGMKVILDLVYFHCGPNAVFIKEHPDFVLRDETGGFDCGQWHFPKLNFASGELREYLWQNMEYFIREYDVDGYRCDVGDACPLDFWEEGRKRIDLLKPDIIMLNEGHNPAALKKAFNINYELIWLNALLKAFKGGGTDDLINRWKDYHDKLPEGGLVLRMIDSHDYANESFDNRFEKVLGSRAVEAALVLNFTIDGIPFLYNGYEVCDAQRHSIFANRFYGRGMTIDWSKALSEEGKNRMALIKKLSEMRHTEPVLTEGDVKWLANDVPDELITFERNYEGRSIVAVINTSSKPLAASVDVDSDTAGIGKTLIDYGAHAKFSEGKLKVDILPHGYVVVELFKK